eukprot:1923075-Alexandrium_andersonii.AAC.1
MAGWLADPFRRQPWPPPASPGPITNHASPAEATPPRQFRASATGKRQSAPRRLQQVTCCATRGRPVTSFQYRARWL